MFRSLVLLNKSIATISIVSLVASFLICSSVTMINVSDSFHGASSRATSSHDMHSHAVAMSHSGHTKSQPVAPDTAHIEHFKSLALALIPSFVSIFVQLFAIIFIIFIASKLSIFIESKSRIFKEESPPFKILRLISKSCSPRSPPVFI